MKRTSHLPEAPAAPVLSEARKRAAVQALRQRYDAHQQATGRTPTQEFQQLPARDGAR